MRFFEIGYKTPRVQFLSFPEFYELEKTVKNNTVRIAENFQEFDLLRKILKTWEDRKAKGQTLDIEIVNKKTNEYFVREMLDITFWAGFFIFTFSLPDEK